MDHGQRALSIQSPIFTAQLFINWTPQTLKNETSTSGEIAATLPTDELRRRNPAQTIRQSEDASSHASGGGGWRRMVR